jgi:DNA modification methylase
MTFPLSTNGTDAYHAFLQAKAAVAQTGGFDCEPAEVHRILKPHQRDVVCWAVRGGRRAIFASFGLGKTVMQLEVVRLTLQKAGGARGLIVCPLGVRSVFRLDAAELLETEVRFIRSTEEARAPGIYLTNYESVREGKVDPSEFQVVSLDEADVLRSFGSKTFSEIVIGPWCQVPYRFVATATPDPNDYLELLGYAQFLGVMDIGQAKTRFFKRDSEKADRLTLHAHKEREFWLWVASWGLVIQRPSDLGHSDEGYALPPMEIRWHELPSDHAAAGSDRSGQARLFRNSAYSIPDAARERRESLPARIAKLMELREADDPRAHRIIWHDLEAEREAIEKAIPGVVSVYGNQDLDDRETAVIAFSEGEIQELAAKPVLAGAGCNFQRYCSRAVFLGIGYKFRDFIQAVHRIHRFLQDQPVTIDLIYTEAERPIRQELEAKWARYNRQTAHLSQIIREYGLAHVALNSALTRSMGVHRQEESGEFYRLVNNDAVEETLSIERDSIGLIVTSIPFSSQYEYTPSFNDFGHTDSSDHFWQQMEFLSPELYRVLQPGRALVVHIKDRVVPGAMTGLGFQVVHPFHAEAIFHYQRHGFSFLGMKTIVTDVVRENNQTYRLGWTEQCKDGSRMGAGLPEYLLIFRRPPSDSSNGYADQPVRKDKAVYTRARWQVDAHGFSRSSGNRLLSTDEIAGLPWRSIFRLFREYSGSTVYDFEHHVALGEAIDRAGHLPPDFMLLPPVSWHPDVWTDITRMRSLNGTQAAAGRQKHLCPLPFDIVERAIAQYSQPGEWVLDPFSGLGTVPFCAVKLGRRGMGIELNPEYFRDGVRYVQAAAQTVDVPTLFDLSSEGTDLPIKEAV